jgi:hypothetical protein
MTIFPVSKRTGFRQDSDFEVGQTIDESVVVVNVVAGAGGFEPPGVIEMKHSCSAV